MSRGEQHGRLRSLAIGLAVLLVLVGALTLVAGLRGETPPQPPTSRAASSPAPPTPSVPASSDSAAQSAAPPSPAAGAVPPLLASAPVRLDIPAIDVTSALFELGLNPDGTVEVPPLSQDAPAGWYGNSPTPGALGPSVVLGHVDSAEYGPGVFFRLGALRPGDTIAVTRADDTTAVFAVDRVVSYPKARFPTAEVYGNTDRAALRLITCGGAFDQGSRSYVDNVIVFASLAATGSA